MSRTLLLSLPLLCLGTSPVLAAAPTPERATAAEDAVRDFINDLLGPSLHLDKPVHFQPNGDGYDASVVVSPGQQITARVMERDAGIWTFEGLHYPIPLHFTLDIPGPTPNAPEAHLTYDIKAAEQDGAGSIDTTGVTPSTTSTSFRAMDIVLTGTDQSSNSHVDRASGASTLRPGKAAGTVDVLSNSTIAGYSIVAAVQTPQLAVNLRLETDALEAKAEIDGVPPDRGKNLVRQFVTLIAKDYANRAAATADTPPIDPAAVHDLVAAFEGAAASMTMDETATKLHGVVNGFAFDTERVRFGMNGQSPDGQFGAGFGVEADGLNLPALAGSPMAGFIPSKVKLQASIAGLNTHDMLAALQAASDPARPADAGPPPEFFALLQSPNLATGIDALEIDLGPSVLTGTGKVTVPSPGRIAGTGRIAVTQFDALTDRVKSLPQANQVLPVMLFAKGIGRTEGEQLVWDINYDGGKVLVNGVDVMAMAGGNARPAPPAHPGPATPPPAPGNRPNRR